MIGQHVSLELELAMFRRVWCLRWTSCHAMFELLRASHLKKFADLLIINNLSNCEMHLYGGTPLFRIKRSFLDDWFCGSKWSKVGTNFENKSMCKMSRQSQRSFDRLQATISDVNTGFEVCPVYYGTLVSPHKVQMSILEVRYDGKDITKQWSMHNKSRDAWTSIGLGSTKQGNVK